MSNTWKAAIGILLVFLLGCAAGALSASVFFHHSMALLLQRDPNATANALEKRLTHQIDLAPDQHDEIHRILMDYLKSRKQLQAQIQPEIQALNLQTFQQIRSVLRPDQVPRFHDNVVAFRRRLARAMFQNPPPAGSAAVPESTPLSGTNAPPATPLPAAH